MHKLRRRSLHARALAGAWQPEHGPSPRAVLACLTLSIAIAIVTLFAWNLAYERDVAVETAADAAVNLAESLAQQASDSFEAIDSALLGLAERFAADSGGSGARARLRESMAAQVRTMSRLHQLLIVDGQGRSVVSNESAAARPDLRFAGTPYFRYHRDHRDETVHISGPDWSRSEHLWLLHVTRRIERSDGSFAGVAVAQIAIDSIAQRYAGINVGRLGVIALIADDGTLLVRKPLRAVGRSVRDDPLFAADERFLPAGTISGVSVLDGRSRLCAFRRLGRYPAIVSVALSPDDYLADWHAAVWKRSIALALVLLLIAGLAGALDVQMRKRKRAEESLARLALIDGLTGVANRRQFDVHFEREWRLAGRARQPLALLMIDVDDFKAYNDSCGHQCGDEVLKQIAVLIAACVYRTECCARYGGEEFAVILPGTTLLSATAIAERIRAAVFAAGVPHATSAAGFVSVSIGVAATVPMRGDERAMLLAAADGAMYLAKRAGRNTIAAAPAAARSASSETTAAAQNG